jgi:unsaturated rhamnogalacturonyl hydrolase
MLHNASYTHPQFCQPSLLASYAPGSSSPIRDLLISSFNSQVKALLPLQDKATGLWHTVLDDPSDSSYLESSCTAGFTYGALAGLRTHLVKGSDTDAYRTAAFAGLNGVLGCIIEDDYGAFIERTSAGTPVFWTKQEYLDVPVTPMPYGQSMAILALVEWLKAMQ